MLLKKVRLVNIKSHADTEIDLLPGINAIIGEQGSGKTTILEAIGSVMFQHLGYKQKHFVREGESGGKVIVTVDIDGKDYFFIRGFGANAEYYVQDSDGEIVVEQAKEVMAWMRDQMDIDPNTDMTMLFENVIAVPQGAHTAHFLLTPSARKKVFDPILGIEAYPEAWSRLLYVSKISERKIQQHEVEMGRLNGLVEGLEELKTKQEELEEEHIILEKSLVISKTNLGKHKDTYNLLEETRKKSERLPVLREEKKSINSKIADIEKKLEEVKKSEKEIKKLEPIAEEQSELEDTHIEIMEKLARLTVKKGNLREYVQKHEALGKKAAISKETLGEYDEIKRIAETFIELDKELEDVKRNMHLIEGKMDHLEKYREYVSEQKCPILKEECPKSNLKQVFGEILDTSGEQYDELNSKLTTLKNNHRQARNAGKEMSNLNNVRNNLEEMTSEIANLSNNISRMEKEVSEWDNLQKRNREINMRKEELGNPSAKLLSLRDRVGRKDFLLSSLESLIKRKKEKIREIKALKLEIEDFDEEQLRIKFEEVQRLNSEVSTKEENLRNVVMGLGDIKPQIETKEQARDRLRVVEKENEHEEDLLEFIKDTRKVIKKVPEFLVEKYLYHINYDGNKIMREMSSNISDIEWKSDYELTLNGRAFRQLSGGEGMTVSLAIRLALLKNLTSVDIAFFDEPTTNLDSKHRTGLAEMIQNIKGFKQLFVISHDDTFDTVIENSVHVRKNLEGMSEII